MDIQLLLQNNLLLISLLGLFSIILSAPNYVSGLFTLVTVLLLSYFLHLFSHFNTPIINILSNTHTKYHHSKEKNKYIDLITEFLVNFFVYGSVLFYLIIIYFYPTQNIIHFRVLLMYSLFYTSIHILDYTLGDSDIHKMHHKEVEENNRICNLGPDFIDKMFSTHCNNQYENTNKYTINLIIIFVVLQFSSFYLK